MGTGVIKDISVKDGDIITITCSKKAKETSPYSVYKVQFEDFIKADVSDGALSSVTNEAPNSDGYFYQCYTGNDSILSQTNMFYKKAVLNGNTYLYIEFKGSTSESGSYSQLDVATGKTKFRVTEVKLESGNRVTRTETDKGTFSLSDDTKELYLTVFEHPWTGSFPFYWYIIKAID